MTTLDESSVRRRELDLITHNTRKRQALTYCTNSHAYNEMHGFLCNCVKKVAL